MKMAANLGNWAFAITAADTHTVHNIALLGFVPHSACLLGPCRPADTSDGLAIAVFPAPHAEQKAHNIALLLAPKLLNVLHARNELKPITAASASHSSNFIFDIILQRLLYLYRLKRHDYVYQQVPYLVRAHFFYPAPSA